MFTPNQQNFRVLLPAKIAQVVGMIQADTGMSVQEAFSAFYNSPVYADLETEATSCWWESPADLYRDFKLC